MGRPAFEAALLDALGGADRFANPSREERLDRWFANADRVRRRALADALEARADLADALRARLGGAPGEAAAFLREDAARGRAAALALRAQTGSSRHILGETLRALVPDAVQERTPGAT